MTMSNDRGHNNESRKESEPWLSSRFQKSRFKARALAYLRKVHETGEPVVILDRGRSVVKVVPYRSEAEDIFAHPAWVG
jgi:prevent-host-death family protein